MSFVRYTVESDVGKKRAINEDRAAFLERSGTLKLAVLADGMGGHNAGDVASEMAVVQFEKYFMEADASIFEHEDSIKQWLHQSVSTLNYEMYHYSLTHENCHGMGTTLIVAVLTNKQIIISHVGDSRVYTITNDETLLVTRDHSYVNMLLELGQISEEEAQMHPKKNAILKAVGTESTIAPDFYKITINNPMHVLICSDGLSNKLSEGEIAAILALSLSLEEKGKKLVQLANDSGGEDNISFVLICFEEAEVE